MSGTAHDKCASVPTRASSDDEYTYLPGTMRGHATAFAGFSRHPSDRLESAQSKLLTYAQRDRRTPVRIYSQQKRAAGNGSHVAPVEAWP